MKNVRLKLSLILVTGCVIAVTVYINSSNKKATNFDHSKVNKGTEQRDKQDQYKNSKCTDFENEEIKNKRKIKIRMNWNKQK